MIFSRCRPSLLLGVREIDRDGCLLLASSRQPARAEYRETDEWAPARHPKASRQFCSILRCRPVPEPSPVLLSQLSCWGTKRQRLQTSFHLQPRVFLRSTRLGRTLTSGCRRALKSVSVWRLAEIFCWLMAARSLSEKYVLISGRSSRGCVRRFVPLRAVCGLSATSPAIRPDGNVTRHGTIPDCRLTRLWSCHFGSFHRCVESDVSSGGVACRFRCTSHQLIA